MTNHMKISSKEYTMKNLRKLERKTHEEFLLKRYTCKQFYPRYFSPQLVLDPDFLTHHKDAPMR